jgi:acyl-CoA synthetase (NDP forming)
VRAARILEQAREEKRTVLTEIEAKQMLKEAGINCTDTRRARTKTEAVAASEEIGYPVVLKVSSVDISHKSDAGGVKVNLAGRSEVEEAFDEIMASCRAACPDASIEGVSVQSMVRAGVEIIMGMYKDADFGPVVMFGMGGVLVEVLEDVAFRIVPIEKGDAAEMIHEIQGHKLLEGYRGQDPVDIPCLEEMLVTLSDFVNRTPGIEEIDINPVFAYREGAVAVDARIVVSA